MPIDFNLRTKKEEEERRISEKDMADPMPAPAQTQPVQEASPQVPEAGIQGMGAPMSDEDVDLNIKNVYENHQALDDARQSVGQIQSGLENQSVSDIIQGQGRIEKDAGTMLRDDYSLSLDPGVWDAISARIADTAENEGQDAADELSYKYACAIEYANQTGMSVEDSMSTLDEMLHSQYGDKYKNYKSSWTAIKDSFTMGKNTVALADLGNKLQTFEMLGDEENAQKCRDKIKAYNEYNETLQDSQPRSWMIEALKSGAQTLPYSAAVGLPSMLAGLIAPGVGTFMGFAAGFDATYGLEYIDLRDAGVDPKVASSVAALSSAGQAAVEQSLGTIANTAGSFGASVGRRALSNTILEKGMDEVSASLSKSMFQHFHFGEQGFKAIARGLMEYGENALEEGAEEAIQEYISAGGKYLAAWASDNDIDLPDAQEIWASAVEEAKGAFMGSLILGIPDAAFSAKATARDFVDVRNQALSAQSKEAFIKEMQSSGSQVFEGMSEEQIKESASNIFDKFTTDREKQADALTKENAENYTAEEGMEVLEADEQGNETEAPAEYRRDGKLYTQDDLTSIDEDGNTHGTFRAGDQESGKNYGYIKYTVDNEGGKVTIDSFRMTESRDYLRKELFEDFADNFADYDIEWNPTGKQARNIKENLIKANPRGADAGLSYYTTAENQQVTRARVEAARQVRQNFRGFTDKEVYHAVSFFEAMAQADGKNIQEFMDQRFGGQIFGDSAVLDQAARMQNAVDENGNSIAKGGIDIQGVKDSIRATIYAGEKADFSTWIHELTHLWRKMQDSESLKALEDALGVKDGVWTDDQDEKLAELSEAAFTGGQVRNESLKGLLGGISNILQKIKDYIQRIASIMMRRGGLNDTITSELSKMIKGDDSLMMKAAQADREAQDQDRKQQEEKEAAASPEENIRKAEQTASQDETLQETKERLIRSDSGTETAEQVQQTQQVMESGVASLSEKSESTMDESGSLRDMAEAQKDIPDMLFQLVGKSVISQSPELSKSFLTFVQMKKQGYSAEDIKQATGWEQDAQGNVWHEEDNLTFRNETIEKDIEGLLKDNEKYRNAIITLKPLSEIVKDNEALLYPGLKDATVYLINMPVNKLDAMYMGDSNAIVINTAQVKEGWGFTRALTNGIQQAVLRSEGLMDMNADVLEKLIAQNSIYISELKKQGVQLTEEQKKSVSDLFTEYYSSAVGKIAQRAEERYARNEKPSTLFFTPAAPKLQFQSEINENSGKERNVKFNQSSSLDEAEDVRLQKKLGNKPEEKAVYEETLDKWEKGEVPTSNIINVGSSGLVFRKLKFPNLPITMDQTVLGKGTRTEKTKNHSAHGLTIEQLKKARDIIYNPAVIFRSEKNTGKKTKGKSGQLIESYTIIGDQYDNNGDPLLIALDIDKQKGWMKVNEITSIYGKKNPANYINKKLDEDSLRYYNNEKCLQIEFRIGVQFAQRLQSAGIGKNIPTFDDLVNDYKVDKSRLQFQTAFHGTSADFDRFSNEHINEGEGSQSFGYGLYFTQAQDIARDYADRQAMDKLNVEDSASLQDFAARRTAYLMLQNKQLDIEEAKLSAWNDQSKAFDRQKQNLVNDASLTDEQKDEKYRQIEKNAAALGKAFQDLTFDDIKKQASRNLYTVEIPDSGYIDWEGDVSAKDAQKVKKGLREALLNDPDSGYDQASARYLDEDLDGSFQELTGQQLYGNLTAYLGSDRKASELLHNLGFKGIKYPAGTNFGYKGTASNFVIFSDEDIAITEHIQFQTEDELMKDAASFDSWKEFMDYYQIFGSDAVPSDADATWYENTWSRAQQIQSTEEKLNNAREEHAEADTAEDMEGDDPIARDALFVTALKSRPNMLEDFLSKIEEIRDEDYIAEPQDQEEADYNEHLRQQKDYISKFVKHATVKSYAKGVASGKSLDLAARTKIANTMGNSARAYRALYADVMQDSTWQVRKEDTVEAQIKGAQEELKKLTGIESDANIDTMSAEERTKIAKKLQNEVLREKVKNGTVLAGADYDSLIRQMEGDIKAKQDEIDENQRKYQETLNDIADYEQRDLLKKYEELLVAKAKYGKTGTTASKHAESAVQTGERYRSGAYQDEMGTYNGIYRRYKDAEKLIKATEEVKYAQKLLEKTQELKEDVRDRKAEQSEVRRLKDLRKRLVKRTMRRVDFKNIDYTHARTLIAIQRLFEPNLEGGVNRWIGTEGRWARDIWSQYYTDSDARKKILKQLDRVGNSAAMDLMQLLENTKSEDDFAKWTNKQRQAVYKLLPKEDWVKELNLLALDKEREESIQLPMEERTYTRKVKGADGKTTTETIWRLEPSEELAKEIRDCVGVDLYNDLTYKDFAEWTTADMEKLARKVDDYYVEGKNELAARKKARKDMAAEYRDRIQKAIKNTGIVINADDSPEEKARKQKKIDRILGFTDGLKGTAQDSTKRQSIFNKVLHGYFDANVRRVARILDNQGEGINTDLLYWGENEAYNNEERAKERRVNKVNDAMQKAGVSVEDLYKKVEIDDFYGDGRSITLSVDELLYYYQAQFDEMSRDAVAYGSMMDVKDREAYQAQDREYLDLLTKLDEEATQGRAEGNEEEANKALEEREKILNIPWLQSQTKALRKAHPGWSDERISREVHLKNPGTEAYKAECNRRYGMVLDEANRIMNENKGLKAFAEAIADDYATEFDRIQQTSIDVFNSPVARVENYVPLVRLSLGGDTNENRVKADLLAQTADASSQQGVDKGMTQKRIKIAPLNQRPVEAGLYKTWADQVERTEHFIAYADYVRTLRDVYGSRDSTATMQWMESRYGKGMKDYVKDYISEVANPQAGQQRSSIDSFVRAMRGKTAPAYLSWKMSSVIKQAITSPMPYMQFMSPVEYLGQVFRMIAHPKQMEDAIKSKSMFMKSRKFDPIADVIDEEMNKQNNPKVVTLWNQFSNLGMQGLEWIDWVCVAPGWNAIYEREYKALSNAAEEKYQQQLRALKENTPLWESMSDEEMNREAMEGVMTPEEIERKAVDKADDCVRLAQPSNRTADISPLFKTKGTGNEIVKALLQFTMSLNVIWQNIRYDLPYAVKNSQYKQAVGMIAGYTLAGIGLSMLDGNVPDGDDDAEEQAQKMRNLIYGATTQFTDAMPIIGSAVSTMDEKLITGQSSFSSGTDLFPTLTKFINGTTSLANGDWDKAAKKYGEGVAMFIGAPVSGTKELMHLLGLDDDEEGMELHPEAVLGQRD